MSKLTDDMNAAIATLEAKLTAGGVTADEVTAKVHEVVDPQFAAFNSTISAILTSESDSAAKVADLTAAFTEFTTAFAPAATPAPSPAPAPDAAPDAAPQA